MSKSFTDNALGEFHELHYWYNRPQTAQIDRKKVPVL